MIGGEDLEGTVGEPLPDDVVMRCVPWRGAATVLRAFGAFTIQVGCGQEKVLRAGLTIDLEPGGLRPPDLGHRFTGGDVHD